MPLLLAYGLNRFSHEVAQIKGCLEYFSIFILFEIEFSSVASDLGLHCLPRSHLWAVYGTPGTPTI